MLNIQFMSEEQTSMNKRGDKIYIPDYGRLRANACCKEEIEAINKCEEMMENLEDGFAFQIVFTTYTKVMHQDLKTMEITWDKEWTIYQYPWTHRYDEATKSYIFDSKEDMVSRIAIEYCHEHKII